MNRVVVVGTVRQIEARRLSPLYVQVLRMATETRDIGG